VEEEQIENEYRELFLQPGWKRFVAQAADWEKRIAQNAIHTVRNMDDVWKQRGQLDVLAWCRGFEQQMLGSTNADAGDYTNPQERH
jgi:hypothetical protein